MKRRDIVHVGMILTEEGAAIKSKLIGCILRFTGVIAGAAKCLCF
jgi:hypothetical protein